MTEDLFRNAVVFAKQKLRGFGVNTARALVSEFWHEVAALTKILITSGALLPIPALLVNKDDGRKNRQPLDGERNVCQISNRAVAVLEVKRVKEFFRFLAADLLQRLFH